VSTPDHPASARTARILAVVVLATVLVGAAVYVVFKRSAAGLPSSDSREYARTTSHFYRGLANLEVGLIDAAKQELTAATTDAPGEPAIWADLGLAHLRLGEFDAAAPAIERALALAPENADVVFLSGRLDVARGRRDQGVAAFRRAVDLDPTNLRFRTALIQEVENAGGPAAEAEAQTLIDHLAAAEPGNLAVMVERARMAAKRGDARTLAEAVARLDSAASGWPSDVIEHYRAVQQAVAAGNTTEAARAIAFLRNVLTRVPVFLEARRRVTPSVELVADPIVRFLRLPVPEATPSPADTALTLTPEPSVAPLSVVSAIGVSRDGQTPAAIAATDATLLSRSEHRSGPPASWRSIGTTTFGRISSRSVAPAFGFSFRTRAAGSAMPHLSVSTACRRK
jgi:tetratricopeptide (TPR) repeat protein